jgi:hypothetical protein
MPLFKCVFVTLFSTVWQSFRAGVKCDNVFLGLTLWKEAKPNLQPFTETSWQLLYVFVQYIYLYKYTVKKVTEK